MKKSSVKWLFMVIVLSLLLAISVILGFTGYYFSVSYLNSNSELTVGDSFSIEVRANESNVASFTFDGTFLPNEKIPQIIQIKSQNLTEDVYIRVKAVAFGGDKEIGLDFETTEHFYKAIDGYYYFDDVLQGGGKTTFCNFLILPEKDCFESRQKYILTFVVETLKSDLDIKNIWKIEELL